MFPLLVFGDTQAELEAYIKSRVNGDSLPNGERCGFRYQIMLNQHRHLLSGEFKKLAEQLLAQPERQKLQISPSGHFTLHYDTSGYHAVPLKDSLANGIPDYIDSAAVILDQVWQMETGQLGFPPPPDKDGNPVSVYHVYFTRFGYYGLTNFNFDEDIPSLPGNNYPSYMELHCNFEGSQFKTKGLDGLRVTAAHEFNHAIQLGYNFRIEEQNQYPDLYFMEMTSTWMEDYVYEEINDYLQYLKNFIPNISSYAFNSESVMYANSIYLHMLERQYGAEAVVAIWDQIRIHPSLSALDIFLQTKNSSFAESHITYACWLYFTAERGRNNLYFPEGDLYPKIQPKSGVEEIIKTLNPLRMRHVLVPVELSRIYQAQVSGNLNTGMFNHIANGGQFKKAVYFRKTQLFSQSKDAPLIAVLTNYGDSALASISYELQIMDIFIAENPVIAHSSTNKVTFFNIPAQGQINIYSIDGRLLAQIDGNQAQDGQVSWDLRNRSGKQVAAGLYLFMVKLPGKTYSGKFVVLK